MLSLRIRIIYSLTLTRGHLIYASHNPAHTIRFDRDVRMSEMRTYGRGDQSAYVWRILDFQMFRGEANQTD